MRSWSRRGVRCARAAGRPRAADGGRAGAAQEVDDLIHDEAEEVAQAEVALRTADMHWFGLGLANPSILTRD